MDIPSLFMIPSAVSSGKVHSVFPNSTDADFNFNRDSSATRVNSQGLIETVGYFGSEEVTDGNFNNGLTNWIVSGTDSTHFVEAVSTGARFVSDTVSPVLELKQNAITSGKQYVLTCNVIYTGAGQLRVNVGSNLPAFTEGANTRYFTATSNTMSFLRENANVDAIISNVSVKEVLGDRARLNYEIEGGLVNTKPSLLLEPQSTNSLTYSNDFANSYWTKSGTSISSNAFVSPDGASNASELIEDTSNSTHQITRSITNVTSNQYSISVFAKANTRNWIRLSSGDGGFVFFNLADNSIGTQTNATGVIKDMGNGWRRCEITFTALGTSGSATVRIAESNGVTSYVGQNKSVYLYGMQYEQLSYSTSYIPTNGSTQTRAAETCNGAGTSSILPSEEGILYAEIQALADDLSNRAISLSDGSLNNGVQMFYYNVSNRIRFRVYASGVLQGTINKIGITITDNHKIALKWKNGFMSVFIDGAILDTPIAIASTPTGLDRLNCNLGQGSSHFYGKIRDIRVYNTKEMTDSEVDILLTKITS